MRAPLLVAAALAAAACEAPWTLRETGTTAHELVAVTRLGDALWMGTDDGRFLRLAGGSASADLFPSLSGGNTLTARIKGLVPGLDGDLYAWTDDALLHGTGGAFNAMPPPDGVTPALRAWSPSSVVHRGDTLFIATRVGSVSRLVEMTDAGFSSAPFADMSNSQVTWLARSPDGRLWGGDAANGADTLFQRGPSVWTRDAHPLGLKGALKVAASDDTFFVVTDDGVHALAIAGAHAEDASRLLPGRYTDLCVTPGGDVFVVGKPTAPWFALWQLVDGRWANVGTGTREALWALHCADDGAVIASGGHGIVVEKP